MKLSLDQWAAVRASGNSLIISVPGAGKTRILQAKAIQEAAKLIGRPQKVACLTYTNAAATELRRRILPSIRMDARENLYIGTIHSFCINRIIAPNAGRLGDLSHGHRLVTLSDPVAVETIEGLLGHDASWEEIKIFENLQRDSEGRAIERDPRRKTLIEAYWARLLEVGCIDFSGVLFYARRVLEEQIDTAETIASVFKWFLIDEYQDTAPAQLAILRLIANHQRSAWMLVGDLNQSIFGFSGVAREPLIDFATSLECSVATFEVSYRCSGAICIQASDLISNPRMIPMFAEPTGEALTAFGEVSETVKEFIQELKKRGVPFSSAAIIASQKWALDAAAEALQAEQPAVSWAHRYGISGTTTVSRLVSSILACVHHSERTEHFLDAITIVREIGYLAGYKSEMQSVERLVTRMITDINDIGIDHVRFADAGSRIMAHIKCALPVNLNSNVDSILEISMRPKLLRGSPLQQFNGLSLARLACSHDAVTIATIHQAKGLEFRAVLLAAYEKDVLPRKNPDDAAEEVRKAYVAITRPSEFLMYGMREWKKSPLWFRSHNPA